MGNSVVLKGGRGGVRIILDPSLPLPELLHDISRELSSRMPFLSGAQVAFETSGRPLCRDLVSGLFEMAEEMGSLSILGISSSGPPVQAARVMDSILDTEIKSSSIHHVRGSLRNGKVAYAPGDLLVHGNVNPGAEARAGGDVYVLGVLQGTASAGNPDNPHAIIYAASMEPRQLRISDVAAMGDGQPGQGPEVALLKNGVMEVMPWPRHVRLRED